MIVLRQKEFAGGGIFKLFKRAPKVKVNPFIGNMKGAHIARSSIGGALTDIAKKVPPVQQPAATTPRPSLLSRLLGGTKKNIIQPTRSALTSVKSSLGNFGGIINNRVIQPTKSALKRIDRGITRLDRNFDKAIGIGNGQPSPISYLKSKGTGLLNSTKSALGKIKGKFTKPTFNYNVVDNTPTLTVSKKMSRRLTKKLPQYGGPSLLGKTPTNGSAAQAKSALKSEVPTKQPVGGQKPTYEFSRTDTLKPIDTKQSIGEQKLTSTYTKGGKFESKNLETNFKPTTGQKSTTMNVEGQKPTYEFSRTDTLKPIDTKQSIGEKKLEGSKPKRKRRNRGQNQGQNGQGQNSGQGQGQGQNSGQGQNTGQNSGQNTGQNNSNSNTKPKKEKEKSWWDNQSTGTKWAIGGAGAVGTGIVGYHLAKGSSNND